MHFGKKIALINQHWDSVSDTTRFFFSFLRSVILISDQNVGFSLIFQCRSKLQSLSFGLGCALWTPEGALFGSWRTFYYFGIGCLSLVLNRQLPRSADQKSVSEYRVLCLFLSGPLKKKKKRFLPDLCEKKNLGANYLVIFVPIFYHHTLFPNILLTLTSFTWKKKLVWKIKPQLGLPTRFQPSLRNNRISLSHPLFRTFTSNNQNKAHHRLNFGFFWRKTDLESNK